MVWFVDGLFKVFVCMCVICSCLRRPLVKSVMMRFTGSLFIEEGYGMICSTWAGPCGMCVVGITGGATFL